MSLNTITAGSLGDNFGPVIGAGATVTAVPLATGGEYSRLRVLLAADQAGTLTVSQSFDGDDYVVTTTTASVAGTPLITDFPIVWQNLLITWRNAGASPTTTFSLGYALVAI